MSTTVPGTDHDPADDDLSSTDHAIDAIVARASNPAAWLPEVAADLRRLFNQPPSAPRKRAAQE